MSKLSRWKNQVKPQGIPRLDSSSDKYASVGQERLFFLQQLHGNSLFYQYGHLYKFPSSVDIHELERRFTDVLKNHEVLRSNYFLEKDRVKVSIDDLKPFELEKSSGSKEAFFLKTFDLEKDLLIRAKVFNKDTLAISMHHIVADRQSLNILNKVLFDEQSLVLGRDLDYFDFASWYNKNIDKAKDLDYWVDKLTPDLPTLNLPLDHARSLSPTYAGKTIEKKLSRELQSEIQKICTSQQLTMYVFLLGAFKLLLHKYSNQHDILVGTPISNRDSKELDDMIGFFNETIVLRSKISPNSTLYDFLLDLKKEFLNSLAHKNISFSSLVSEVNPHRIPGVNPIFQTMFLFNRDENILRYKNEIVSEEIVDLGISKFDMTLFTYEDAKGLSLRLEFSTELFEKSSAIAFLNDYESLLKVISDDPLQKIKELTVYPRAAEFLQKNRYDALDQNSVLELMDFSSKKKAVIYLDQSITYEELGRKSDKLAGRLLHLGLQENQFVGLYTRRSVEMIIGILAILKAGGAYLPLDPNYPEERINFMIEDAKCQLILSTRDQRFFNHNYIDINEDYDQETLNLLPTITKQNLAYLIYTSGSSGKPKGVSISHENLLYSTCARFKFYDSHPTTFILLSSFSFDSSVAGIFWTLCNGGELLLPPERIEQDIHAFAGLIEKHRVTHTLMLPSLYEVLLDFGEADRLRSLMNVVVAGEACSQKLVDKHFQKNPPCRLYNEYGPTEATVWCIAHEIMPGAMQVPIGKAIPFYQAYILDAQMQRVPPRVSGELYIGGPGLSQGYLNREDLTRDKFIEHKNFGRIYKTGDIAKSSLEGQIYFLGRADSQVKIRGHRVELEEIKNRMIQHSDSTEAEVIFKDGKLLAYSNAPVEGSLDLPDYMTPSHFVLLQDFPKLPNGKTDLKQLPMPKEGGGRKLIEAPRSEVEKTLLKIWKEVVKQDKISINDNFFDIGGDSLLSIQMVARARKEGISMLASSLFANQTIKKLARNIEESTRTEVGEIVVPLKKEGQSIPLFCIHGGGAHVFFYKPFAKYLKSDTPVYSFQPAGLDGETAMAGDIVEMASKYITEMKKIQPIGPYQILGTCFSNAVALEMANQLLSHGERVEKLFIIDSAPVHLFGNNERLQSQTFQRFFDMLKRGDFTRIKSKLSRRIFGQKRWTSPIKEATESDQILKTTISALNTMYANYDWKPFDGKIHFIRSSEFNGRKDKNYHLIQWNKLARSGVVVEVVHGHHLSLFQEPEVQGLANKISSMLVPK